MASELIKRDGHAVGRRADAPPAPAIIERAGGNARFAYDEFFRAAIENTKTREAYRRAVHRFLRCCDERGLELQQISPGDVGEYLKKLRTEDRVLVRRRKDGEVLHERPGPARAASIAMKKLHLAALRHFFDALVQRHAIILNPALSVRGPKHSVTEGKTPAIEVKKAEKLLASIDTTTQVGLRDRAIIALFLYTSRRVGALAKLRRKDYYFEGSSWMLDFQEKGGKFPKVPAREEVKTCLDDYLDALGKAEPESPLFRTIGQTTKKLTERGMSEDDILRMVKRRMKAVGLPAERLCNHSFRATVITDLLEQDVPVEDVQKLAGHSDIRTTLLYDRRHKKITRNVVERISIKLRDDA